LEARQKGHYIKTQYKDQRRKDPNEEAMIKMMNQIIKLNEKEKVIRAKLKTLNQRVQESHNSIRLEQY
jgi:hypothetical protein